MMLEDGLPNMHAFYFYFVDDAECFYFLIFHLFLFKTRRVTK